MELKEDATLEGDEAEVRTGNGALNGWVLSSPFLRLSSRDGRRSHVPFWRGILPHSLISPTWETSNRLKSRSILTATGGVS